MTENETSLKELNRIAIEEGLMLPDNESLRKDFSGNLGRELSLGDAKRYRAICEATIEGPITPKKLVKEISPGRLKADRSTGSVWVSRIRKKLGFEAIVWKDGGYQSRRVLIERQVEKNRRSKRFGHFHKISDLT